MKLTEQWVQETIDREVADVELVLLEEAGNRRHRVVRLFVDHPAGVGHELCARVSQVVGAALDEACYAEGPYTLEVSSPGLDRPLTKPAHYAAQVGKRVQVKTGVPVEGRKLWRGVLREVRPEAIVMVEGGQEAVIRLEDIVRANLIFEFDRGTGNE